MQLRRNFFMLVCSPVDNTVSAAAEASHHDVILKNYNSLNYFGQWSKKDLVYTQKLATLTIKVYYTVYTSELCSKFYKTHR